MFEVGSRVNRVEDSPSLGAVVVEMYLSDELYYLISYDEGGEGWWPESSLEAA